MKYGISRHYKTEMLAEALGIPVSQVLGHLHQLFEVTGDFAPRGDIGKLSNEIISKKSLFISAESARTTTDDNGQQRIRESERFINALLECNWLEKHDEFRLVVHDWHEHCEEYIRKRLDRAGQTFWNGSKPYSTTKIKRVSGQKKGHENSHIQTESARTTTDDNGVLPCHALPSHAIPSSSFENPPAKAGTQKPRKSTGTGKSIHPGKQSEQEIDIKQDIILWMKKSAQGKKWKYAKPNSKDWKQNQGPTTGMEEEIRGREREDGPDFLRRLWLEFLDTPESDCRYPFRDFLDGIYQRRHSELAMKRSLAGRAKEKVLADEEKKGGVPWD